MDATPKTAQIRVARSSPAYWRVTFDNPPLNLMGPELVLEFREIYYNKVEKGGHFAAWEQPQLFSTAPRTKPKWGRAP